MTKTEWPCRDCKHTMEDHKLHVDPLSNCHYQECYLSKSDCLRIRRCECPWYHAMTNLEYLEFLELKSEKEQHLSK